MSLSLSRLTVTAVLVTTLAGCAAPAQYGGLIPVDHAGLERRLRILCRWGVGAGTAQAGCAAPALRRPGKCRGPADGAPAEPGQQCRPASAHRPAAPAAGPATLAPR